MNKSIKNILFSVLIASILASCSTTKLNPQKTFLVKNELEIDDSRLDEYDINGLIRQKPNRKFLVFRIHTGVYNMGASMKDRTSIKEDKIRKKIQKKKERRPDKYINEQKELAKANRGLRNWLMNTIGEEPVFLDTILTKQSNKQIDLYCKKNGFFNAQVSDSVKYFKKNKKAKVKYKIIAGQPYTINKIDFISSDPNIEKFINERNKQSLIKVGNIYSEDILDKERSRINDELKNNGYYAFSKSYIRYEADSTLGNNTINLKLIVNRPYETVNGKTEFVNHKVYKINKLFAITDYSVLDSKNESYDTLAYVKHSKKRISQDTLFLLSKGKSRIKPKVIARKTFIKPKQVFSLKQTNKTQEELSNLNIFKYINIRFVADSSTNKNDKTNKLDAYIELNQTTVNSINVEVEATNSSGNLGTAGNLVYKNKNLFRGAELFNFRIRGGLELQQTIFEKNYDIINGLPFNSAEISTEAGIKAPLNNNLFVQSSRSMMNYSLGFNYQLRPDYERYISHAKVMLEWKESPEGIVQAYKQINLVRIIPDSLFAARIAQFSKKIRYSYEDHFIPGFGLTYTRRDQPLRKNKSHTFQKYAFEQAGFFYWIGNGFNNAKEGEIYKVLGINYSQYFKIDIDFRYYKPWLNQTTFVQRVFIGIGFPYGNSVLMPFEKSYSASGSNDIRAWKYRALGPGSHASTDFFDKSGDISLVLNTEYRFPIFSWFNGALFVDAGNVWLKNSSEEFPGGEFLLKKFYKQIGIGTGFGLRLDFSFFVFRIDAAFPLRDPALPENKWIEFNKLFKRTNLNFGIGYPF
ncbi:MAG: BamA/TamA family outer membrane protein [Bacteroidales bacterium]|nr:BamA/TamA family outer membrane protein [Bacteroidales bacterium]